MRVHLMDFLSLMGVYVNKDQSWCLEGQWLCCCFSCLYWCHFRETFKTAENGEVVKRLINEVRLLNPQFQAGQIRCKYIHIAGCNLYHFCSLFSCCIYILQNTVTRKQLEEKGETGRKEDYKTEKRKIITSKQLCIVLGQANVGIGCKEGGYTQSTTGYHISSWYQ